MLSSNTRHCAPLERGDWTHHGSIDIALRWSAGIKFVAFYRHCAGFSIAEFAIARTIRLFNLLI